ncbi:hypothetical protein Barb6_01720 [Bacteroidales bacterium Barb6]|nr:hypothetical protein Barb6_01720 [Bacteroidales bacterium Barb6]
MAQFIFYTDEEITISPNGNEVENLQIIGIEDGNGENEALRNLYENNAWIEEYGFSKEKLKCYPILSPDYLANIKKVIDFGNYIQLYS